MLIKKEKIKVWLTKKNIIFLILFIYLLSLSYRSDKAYKQIFRLTHNQINYTINDAPTQCRKLRDCELKPGDVLIRRYITNNTALLVEVANVYLTHSAFYLGGDELFEASGGNEKPEDQVTIVKFSESDWYNQDMKNFIVLRPKNYNGDFVEIESKFRSIASDPEYTFGPLDERSKKVSCSDIILKYLLDSKILESDVEIPRIVTPDYLFWKMAQSKNVEIVGYSITETN